MRIEDFKKGDCARLLDFGLTDPAYRRRLLSLGITRGVELQIVRVAPLGCPIQVDVRGTSISLRREEARHLLLEKA
ncbi:FeoA family protein [Legionella birminghamensis]